MKRCFGRVVVAAVVCWISGLALCLNAAAGDIAIYGDSQHDPAAQRKVVAAIAQVRPGVVFRVGDMVDNGNDPKLWEAFDRIAQPLLTTAEYFPVLGNHEQESPLYFAHFPQIKGQRWYSVERAGVHVAVLDSNADLTPGSEQYAWLEADLKGVKPAVKFTVVIFHHPLFDVGRHQADEKGLKPALLPLLLKYRVSAVFSGHDHNYQRFEHDGLYFIVTGGGGSNLDDKQRDNPDLIKFQKAYHFCLLTPEDAFLNVKVLDVNQHLIDEFQAPSRKRD
ncbi:MAG: metallophosphoesterase [Candidatus Omnitrophica bacterium]|nr:metallophosphoesterase [Candidatus Omnitrophota bacterium]